MSIRLALEPDGQSVVVSLTAYLGDRFSAYRAACAEAGARWVAGRKVNVAPTTAIPTLLAAFARAELPCEVTADVRAALESEAAEAMALLNAGRARVEAIQSNLKSRGLSLYRYQETGVEWLAPRKRALLCDEMGLGKTVQALLALPERGAAVVVAPAAVRHSWQRESMKWRPDLRPIVVETSAQFRWPRAGEILIATFGILPADAGDLGMPAETITLIADEAHAFKNPKAKRTQRWRDLSKIANDCGGRTWLLTGTPLLNRPPELWAVLQAAGLAEEAFGNWRQFVGMFSGQKLRHGYEWGLATEDVPDRLRRVSLHRRRAQVLPDLPSKTRRDVPVHDLDAVTVELCDKALEALEAAGVNLGTAEALAKATALGGVPFELLSRARAALATAKIGALTELVDEYEEAEEPLVVFSAHLPPVLAIGNRPGWEVITGDTSAEKRGAIVDSFQRGDLKGIAGTIGAMGVGVTLTRSSHAILVDLAWTPALNSQAEDRVCRIGQSRGVLITRLVAAHRLDERVCELLTAKQEVIESSVEASAVEADHVGASPAVALAEAASEAARLMAAAEQRASDERARKSAEHEADADEMVRRFGGAWDGREVVVVGSFRSASNAVEAAAARVLLIVAGMDPDHAATRNGVGFNRNDGEFGHSLADSLRKYGRLSDKQWPHAIRLAARYQGQVEATEPEPTGVRVKVIMNEATDVREFDNLAAFLAEFKPAGGERTVGRQDVAITGPLVAGLCGPMFEGPGVLRYEDEGSFAALSS